MKKVWITALSKEMDQKKIMSTVGTYGLSPEGHFWVDDNTSGAWSAPMTRITAEDTALWLILTREPELSSPSIRYGLSLLALSVQSVKGHGFPIILAHQGTLPATEDLPTPLQSAQIVDSKSAALGAKIAAKGNVPPSSIKADYWVDLHNLPNGTLVEVGPLDQAWSGTLFGIKGESAEISHQAVGPRGNPPEKATLNFPMKDVQLDLNGETFNAWGVKNSIPADQSYFAMITGEPEALVFGPLSAGEDINDEDTTVDLFTLRLK